MTGPFVSKREHVYLDPMWIGDGAVNTDPAISIPPEHGLTINGAPVVETSHEFVVKRLSRSSSE